MTPIPRRRFLASASAAATPMLGMGTLAHASRATTSPTSQSAPPLDSEAWQLLAVAPQSRKVQALESDYRRGVELGLAQHTKVDVQLHWTAAAAIPSTAAKSIAAQLERLPQLHGVLGWIAPELERRIAVMTKAHGLPLWVSETGADRRVVPHSAAQPRAHMHHSLALCECAEQLAHDVVHKHGSRAVMAIGWMESGYEFVTAFQQAYRALGGQIVGRHIGGPRPQMQEFEGLRGEVFRNRPDTVVAFYSGPQAERFATWWQGNAQGQGAWGLAGLPPLMAGTNHAHHMLHTSSWPEASKADPIWVQHFEQANLPWSAAALLGAEAGYSIGHALGTVAAKPSSAQLASAWSQAQIAGPRGEVQSSNVVAMARSSPTRPTRISSGWLNGYLQT